MLDELDTVAQRADYTFKHNRNLGRHGWLRLTPAYSVKLVKNLLKGVPDDELILDPFSGTATTGLTAAEHGNRAITFDINPFLIWLGNVKCRNYTEAYLKVVQQTADKALSKVEGSLKREHWQPEIFNIELWWSPHTWKVLWALRDCLVKEFGEPAENQEDGLAWVAFCRLIIETSSAAFNHVSMSFSEGVTHHEVEHVVELYKAILCYILQSCASPFTGHAKVMEVDARNIPDMGMRFDRVITSPPYPNRISYIRELRPYMYWTKFLQEARSAGELDWKAIGGTWGIATSRLNDWKPDVELLSPALFETVQSIAQAESKNGELLATYVFKYFHDMHLHFSTLRGVLANGAELHYIVGNSSFFGNMVDTAELMSASMRRLGYENVKSEIIRKRNCNKALYEYDVTAMWHG